jgi:hypothetical protein
MRCLSESWIRLAIVLFLAQAVSGCLSLQIEKTQEGVDILPPLAEFMPMRTTLDEILAYYGAPAEVVDMHGDFALHYRRALSRGASLSIGFPLKYTFLPNPSIKTNGDLLRYDTTVFIFAADGVLKDMKYSKGTERSLWEDYWN